MNTILSETDYKSVPAEQKERLRALRTTHPREHIDLLRTAWSYLLGGKGNETPLILPGGERIGDVAFPLMQQFEQEYRCLYPSYPPFSTMDALIDGLAALLDRLSIEQVILFAASFSLPAGRVLSACPYLFTSAVNHGLQPLSLTRHQERKTSGGLMHCGKGPVLALRPQATLLNAPLLGLCRAGRLRRYRLGRL